MAKNAKLDMTVDIVNNTEAGLVEVEKSVDKAAKTMQKAGKKTSKNWGGVADLFTGLLPRGMQKTIRSFKSTQRSIGRVSKSFKGLKAAWASVGIGLIIIAVEPLIENWDVLSESIGLTNKSLEEQAKVTADANRQAREVTDELINRQTAYLSILDDQYASSKQRQIALDMLNETLDGAIDREADMETQLEQAREGQKRTIALREAEIALEGKLQAQAIANETLRAHLWKSGNKDAETVARLKKEQAQAEEKSARALEQLTYATEQYNRTVGAVKTSVEDRDKAEKEAAAEKLKSQKQAEANAKYLADLEKTLSEEILLAGIEDEQERQLKVLELRHSEQKIKATLAGATAEQLLKIDEAYQLEREALNKSYTDRQKEEDEADRQQALADEQALEDELFMIRTNGRDRELTEEQLKYEEEMMLSFDKQAKEELRAQQEFDRRIAQAGENQELIKMVEDQYELELTEIKKKGEDERNEIVKDGVDKETKIREAGAKAVISATQNLFGTMEALAGDNEKAAKGFAITGVLLAQAVALANGIKTATQSSATVWDMIAGIVASTAAVLGAFVGVKAILNEATDGGGGNVGGGGGGRSNVQALVPTGVARLDSPEEGNNQAFVVQSELEGANMQANNMYQQSSLNPG